jgi:hypothetical protein
MGLITWAYVALGLAALYSPYVLVASSLENPLGAIPAFFEGCFNPQVLPLTLELIAFAAVFTALFACEANLRGMRGLVGYGLISHMVAIATGAGLFLARRASLGPNDPSRAPFCVRLWTIIAYLVLASKAILIASATSAETRY